MLAGTMCAECVIYGASSKRSAYAGIPAMCFLQFIFSGLFLKPQSMPYWMAPWAPSFSMLRWLAQANFLNIYEPQKSLFKTLLNYSYYEALLNLFGWGGKTKWYCLRALVWEVLCFRFLVFLVLKFRVYKQNVGPIQGQKVED